MAINKYNILTRFLSGMIGKELVFRTVNGNTIVQARPDFSNVRWSAKQKAYRKRFREASRKAKIMAADPLVRKKYEKKLKPGLTVYNVILREILEY